MPNHPVNPDIHLLDGRFYAGDAHRHFDWMRAHAPVYWDEASQLWGVARHADVMQLSKRPRRLLQQRQQPPRCPADPVDDQPRRPGAPTAPRAGQQGLHAAPCGGSRSRKIRRICSDLIERAARQAGRSTSCATSPRRCR